MPIWTESMQQTFEYYIVDPGTWGDIRLLKTVKSCSVDWDKDSITLGSCTMDLDENVGEVYIRTYLVTIQNGVRERFPLGTFLVQTQPDTFDGRSTTYKVDCYSPLLEAKEKQPPIGYFVPEGDLILERAYLILRENLRAPVIKNESNKETMFTDFVTEDGDNWVQFVNDLIANAKYELGLDEMGRILFAPKQDPAALQPVWTYTDDNSSILYPNVTRSQDLYGIPNVVELVYSDGKENGDIFHIEVVNDDPDSPTSIQRRGRRIPHRVTDPSILGIPTKESLTEYAEMLLRELSTIEYTITYTHGYCPVRIGDCVRLNYEAAGLTNVKAVVTQQSISCTPGCPVTETAVYTSKLWRGTR